jgi:hypothetical protein
LTWESLPAVVQRRLCAACLERPLDAALLPHLQQMFDRSGFDERLIAMCVKGHCDAQRYSQAYGVLERSLASLTQQALSRMRSSDPKLKLKAKTALHRYVLDTRSIVGLWQYADRESRRDTAARHVISDEMPPLLASVCDAYARIADRLSRASQAKVILALLDLAKLVSDEPLVDKVAGLFLASDNRNSISVYAKFARSVGQQSVYTRNLGHRQHYLAQFRAWLIERIPDEAAFFDFVATLRGAAESKIAGSHAEADPDVELRALFVPLVALDIAGVDDLVTSLADTILATPREPIDTIRYCVRFLRLRNEGAKTLAFRTLRVACQHPEITERNVGEFLSGFLLLGEREHVLSLHTQGWLDRRYRHAERDLAQAYSILGMFGKSLEHTRHVRRDGVASFAQHGTPRTLSVALGQESNLDNQQFLNTTNEILNDVPQSRAPKGIIVLVAKNAHELNMYPILAIRELKERGFAVVPLVSGLLDYQPTGIPEIDQIADQLNAGMDHARWQDEPDATPQKLWAIDFGARKMAYDGVDVYWGVREDLGCRDRRYSIDFAEPSKQNILADNMRRVELFEVCLRRIAEAGRRLHLPIRLIFPYVHMSSHYYARRYVESLSSGQDIAVIHVANAYENYFSNFGTDEATTLAVRNMTFHRDLAGAYFAPTASFSRYYARLSIEEREGLVDEVGKWTRQHRVQRQVGVGQSDRLDFLLAERGRGKKIVALLGKVLFDLEMPYGHGPAHADMRDWFDHTIEVARANPHIHLLIKPHPHEVREEIALYPNEVLKDWLPADLPGNIHFLGHNEFNVFELTEILDVALLWNGTAALELGVLGVPTIIGAYYGDLNYPVGHFVPESRAHYVHLVTTRDKLIPAAAVSLRAAALMTYLRHPDHSIPYRYTHRGLTNRSIRNLRWFDDDLRKYRKAGDPYVTKIANRIAGTGDDSGQPSATDECA